MYFYQDTEQIKPDQQACSQAKEQVRLCHHFSLKNTVSSYI